MTARMLWQLGHAARTSPSFSIPPAIELLPEPEYHCMNASLLRVPILRNELTPRRMYKAPWNNCPNENITIPETIRANPHINRNDEPNHGPGEPFDLRDNAAATPTGMVNRQITIEPITGNVTPYWRNDIVSNSISIVITEMKTTIFLSSLSILNALSVPPCMRRTHESHGLAVHVSRDTGVTIASRCLEGRRILLAVTGGIAAVESVKLAREIRRHGADVSPMMSTDATRVISPLALSWGSGVDVITKWEPSMSQLGSFDAILVAPATRNTIAKHIHGIMDSPIMMALAASRGNNTPILFVPSMHKDLFDDPVTEELLSAVADSGASVIVDEQSEGRRKQPDPVSIVAELCHMCNSSLPARRKVAITLGANRAPIDSVRAIQNASSGRTGWAIAEHLHRMGHSVVCIAGKTSVRPTFKMPDVRVDGTPQGMLTIARDVASGDPKPDVWIHAAAVLDYFQEPIKGKRPSGSGNWTLELIEGPKHISELSELTTGSFRIGFKLEVNSSEEDLVNRSLEQISRYGIDAVVANNLDDLSSDKKPRCRIVMPDGNFIVIEDEMSMCDSIESLVSQHKLE